MRNSTKRSILGVAIMAVVFAAGASAHNGRSVAKPAKPAPAAPAARAPQSAPIGMVQDWTNQSVIFRNVETPEEAKANNRYQRWQRLYRDPRFSLAVTEKLEAQALAASRKTANGRPKPNPIPGPTPAPTPTPSGDAEAGVHRDWSNILGVGGTNGLGGNGSAGTYPAKYNFDIMATPSCANDFVVYATNAAGVSASGGTSETWTITFSGNPNAGQTVVIGGVAPRQVTLIASSVGNTGLYFQFTGNTTTNATNLRDAINRWSGQTGYSASSAANVVTISSIAPGNITGSYVDRDNLSNTSSGNANGTAGTPGQPSIIAFNKLYNGLCATGGADAGPDRVNDNAPDVYWAYNTGGTVRTSPTMSYYDGAQQIAFVQTNGSNQAELVLLKWKTGAGNGSASAPATPTTALSASDYRDPDNVANPGGCTAAAACMHRMVFNGNPNVTYSSPFIDYSGNIAYVGDDNGSLHKFTGIFSGNPAEVTTGGFPTVVSSGEALSPPVYDFGGNVFVGSQSVADSGGTGETWTLRIDCNDQAGGGITCEGVNNALAGFLTVNGNAFNAAGNNAGTNIDVVGPNRAADRTNIVNEINGAGIGYSAATTGGCNDNVNDAPCDLIITRTATGDAASTLVAVAGSNISITGNTNGTSDAPNGGGRLHRINATTGAVVDSGRLTANNANTGFRATPMIDLKTSVIYASTSSDGTDRAIYQFPLAFTAGATGSKVSVGLGTSSLTTDAQYVGRFDSAYRSSPNGTGNLYVCGSLPGDSTSVAMWRIPITAGVMGAPVQGATLSTSQSLCSPVSLITNGANQYLYAAVPAGGSAQWCTGACLYMFNLNGLDAGVSEQWSFTFPTTQTVGGGTFIVDNVTFNAVSDGDTGANVTNCTGAGGDFDIFSDGGENTDGQYLRGCTSQVAGYTTTGTNNNVIITRNLPGNVADNLVREGVDMNNFIENVGSHVQGVAPSSTTWGTTNVPAAGLTVVGGISGHRAGQHQQPAGYLADLFLEPRHPGQHSGQRDPDQPVRSAITCNQWRAGGHFAGPHRNDGPRP
ncbi:hypothetical protein [Arenimonas sp.]|uniref:hypothetical protein n=1 Tax=Arenimonas sp. TaxID=1872635 RepID=UPI0039E539AC